MSDCGCNTKVVPLLAELVGLGRKRIGISASEKLALSAGSYQALKLGQYEGRKSEARSLDVPDACRLLYHHLQLTESANSPTEVTWFLSLDEDGYFPLTKATVTTINTGATTASATGGCIELLDVEWQFPWGFKGAQSNHLWVHAKVDVGTVQAVARLWWMV